MNKTRESWIDHVKIIACILVVLGHFFQGLIGAEIITASGLYIWFIKTIYYFHVPLFFICSGYLYQVHTQSASWKEHTKHIKKKFITLGIPYFSFSVITWGIKAVFESSVNNPNNDLLESLFLSPISPYWYLYALFFVFLITPVFKNKKMAVAGMFVALLFKATNMVMGSVNVYAIDKVFENEIWFVLGMLLCVTRFNSRYAEINWKVFGITLLILFAALSLIFAKMDSNPIVSFCMGLLGCGGTILVLKHTKLEGKCVKCFSVMSKHTMPIFLMHTIFAAGIRSVILKFGIENFMVHLTLGIAASFVGPVVAAEIMKKIKLDVLIYPGKYMKSL